MNTGTPNRKARVTQAQLRLLTDLASGRSSLLDTAMASWKTAGNYAREAEVEKLRAELAERNEAMRLCAGRCVDEMRWNAVLAESSAGQRHLEKEKSE